MDSNKWLHTVWFQTTESKHFSCPKGKSKESTEEKKEVLKKYYGIVGNEKSLDNIHEMLLIPLLACRNPKYS